jgi:hypothetical protein
MGIGISLILAAAGAIIRFAIEPTSRIAGTFVNWDIVGDILMVAGAAGVLASILWMAAASRRTTASTVPREG